MNYLLNGSDSGVIIDVVDDIKFSSCGKITKEKNLQLESLEKNNIESDCFSMSVWLKPLKENSQLKFLDESGWKIDGDGYLTFLGPAEKEKIEPSIWQQITWICTKTTQRLYLNAKLIASINGTQIPLDPTSNLVFSVPSGEFHIAHFHGYDRELSQHDIISDYAAQQGTVIGSFAEQYPLDVNLVNDQEGEWSNYPDNKLFILDVAGKDVTKQTLSIRNISDHAIYITSQGEQPVSAEHYHLELRFRNETFSEPASYPHFETIEDWSISEKAVQNPEDGSWSIYFLVRKNLVLESSQTLNFDFTYKTAAGLSARGTQLSLSYHHMNFDDDSPIKGQRFKQIDILNLSSNNPFITKLHKDITKSDKKVDELENNLIDLKSDIETAKEHAKQAQQAVENANSESEKLNQLAKNLSEESAKATAEVAKENAEAQAAKEQAESANEAAEQASLHAQQANKDAEQEKLEAEQAKEEAQLATVAAEREKVEAQEAKEAAEKANAAAERARAAAEQANKSAAKESENASEAKEAARLANQKAEDAKEAAISANTLAEKEKAEAVAASTLAKQSNVEAEQEGIQAEKAKGDAVRARNEANAAKTEAELAKKSALSEKNQAVKAKDAAGKFSEAANAAKVAAENAQRAATKAKQEAENTQNKGIDVLSQAQELLRQNVKTLDTELDTRARAIDARFETLESMYPLSMSYEAPIGLICGNTSTIKLYLHNRFGYNVTLEPSSGIYMYMPFGALPEALGSTDQTNGVLKKVVMSPSVNQSGFKKLPPAPGLSVFEWKPNKTTVIPPGGVIEFEFTNIIPNPHLGFSYIYAVIMGMKGQPDNTLTVTLTKENKDIAVRSGNGYLGIGTSSPSEKLDIRGNVKSTGRYMDATGYVMPVGGIIMWSGSASSMPNGWKLCDGSNGTPNLQGRFIVGAYKIGRPYKPNDTGGTNKVRLSVNEMPSHKHSVYDKGHYHPISDPGHSHSVSKFRTSSTDRDDSSLPIYARDTSSSRGTSHEKTRISIKNSSSSISESYKGGGSEHENRPPYYALCFIMKM